eukprot:1218258-Alexandrium_andersonii.AAC.1
MESGKRLLDLFARDWLQHRPRPRWLMVDEQRSLTHGDFVEFCQLIGVGIMPAPGEAHWMHGATESRVGIMKRTQI